MAAPSTALGAFVGEWNWQLADGSSAAKLQLALRRLSLGRWQKRACDESDHNKLVEKSHQLTAIILCPPLPPHWNVPFRSVWVVLTDALATRITWDSERWALHAATPLYTVPLQRTFFWSVATIPSSISLWFTLICLWATPTLIASHSFEQLLILNFLRTNISLLNTVSNNFHF